jgi:pSer/pThr/pTyr-binding forkhead associated (FHA) protein
MFVLVFTRDGRTERHLLTTGDTIVGRSPVCDLIINDPSISRRHARFRVHGDHCLLSDLRGRNGTFLNGELVAEAELAPGDVVTLGRFPVELQRAADTGMTLGEHEPALESPSTLCRRVDLEDADPAAWRPVVDSGRLFALLTIIARRLTRWHSSRELIDQSAEAIFDALPAERAFVLLRDAPGSPVVPLVARTRQGGGADGSTVSRAVVDRVVAERLAILSTDVVPEASMPTVAGGGLPARRWFVCAPLWHHGEPMGALYADSPERAPLGPADLDVLHALGLYLAAALEQARDTDRLLLDAGQRDAAR